jgi:hypothetical protein
LESSLIKSEDPNSKFIFIKRQLLYNAQSLLLARKDFFGDFKYWYSIKPSEYIKLKNRDPFGQVVGQVDCTNAAIEKGLSKVKSERTISITYEDLCHKPKDVLGSLIKWIDPKVDINRIEQSPFEETNSIKLNSTDYAKLQEWFEKQVDWP